VPRRIRHWPFRCRFDTSPLDPSFFVSDLLFSSLVDFLPVPGTLPIPPLIVDSPTSFLPGQPTSLFIALASNLFPFTIVLHPFSYICSLFFQFRVLLSPSMNLFTRICDFFVFCCLFFCFVVQPSLSSFSLQGFFGSFFVVVLINIFDYRFSASSLEACALLFRTFTRPYINLSLLLRRCRKSGSSWIPLRKALPLPRTPLCFWV